MLRSADCSVSLNVFGFCNFHYFTVVNYNPFTKKFLIDVSNNLNRDYVKTIRERIIQTIYELGKNIIVDIKALE